MRRPRIPLPVDPIAQVGGGWMEDPFPYTGVGKILVNGKNPIVNPAYRLGAQQTDKRRKGGDLKAGLR